MALVNPITLAPNEPHQTLDEVGLNGGVTRRMYEGEMAGGGGLVWHYCDGSGLKSILENRVLWASSAAYMNDFKELISGNDVLARSYEDIKLEFSESHHEELQRAVTNFASPREENTYCLGSEDPDSLTLWRYYGRDQVSFAVGLDRMVDLDVRAQKDLNKHPFPPPDIWRVRKNRSGHSKSIPTTTREELNPGLR